MNDRKKKTKGLSFQAFSGRRQIFALIFFFWGFSSYHNPVFTSRQQRVLAGSSMGTDEDDVIGSESLLNLIRGDNHHQVEPSHIQLCRNLLPRLQNVALKYTLEERARQFGIEGLNFIPENNSSIPINGTEADIDKNQVVVIWEDESLCHPSYSTSSSALIQVMASSLLNEASMRYGLNVQYQYPCQKMKSIQDRIVFEIAMERALSSASLNAANIQDLCFNCLQDFDNLNHNQFHGMNCVLFTSPVNIGQSTSKSRSGIGAIFPSMKNVMTNVRKRWLEEMEEREIQPSYLQVRHATTELKTKEEMDLIAGGYQIDDDENSSLSPDDDGDNEEPRDMTASIYISCPYETCNINQPANAMHYSTYTKYIPENISTISVYISEACSSHMNGCMNHAHSLFAYLSEHYLDARLELIQSDSSNTVATYVGLTNSDYLICPPTQGCILPSLFMKEGGRAILASDETIPKWYRDLPLVNIGIWLLPVGGLDMKEVSKLDKSVIS